MIEDIKYLKSWIENAIGQISNLKSSSFYEKEKKIIYMIGNTSTKEENPKPYLTPLRQVTEGYIIGSIVFTQAQARILVSKIDGMVDYIFLDAEKKLPTIMKPDYEPYKSFEMYNLIPSSHSVEYGNISSACAKIIKKSSTFEYKANDLTVDSTWNFLISKLTDLSGKKILIIGSGNIGLKLSLKLVESGAEVILYSRRKENLREIVSSLNSIKNKFVLSNIILSDNLIHSSNNADVLIGCSSSTPIIDKDLISIMNKDGLVIDLGKGTISDDGIHECTKKKIKTWRVDITPMLDSIISVSLAMEKLNNISYGSKLLSEGFSIVSGGYIGNRYDIVVDNYQNPKRIIGVCDRPGKFMLQIDSKGQENIKITENHIKLINK